MLNIQNKKEPYTINYNISTLFKPNVVDAASVTGSGLNGAVGGMVNEYLHVCGGYDGISIVIFIIWYIHRPFLVVTFKAISKSISS